MATETLEGANTLVHSKQTTDPNICPKAMFAPRQYLPVWVLRCPKAKCFILGVNSPKGRILLHWVLTVNGA